MSTLSSPELLISLARQELGSGHHAAAKEKCLQVLGEHHHHPGAMEVLGEVFCAEGRHEDAVRVFNALTLMQPEVAWHWQNLGTVLRPTGRHAQALAAFERALRLAPPTPGLLYNLGVLQMDRGDYDAAYLALRDGAAMAPSDGRLRWAYAQCCFDCGRLDETLEALDDWQQLEGLTAEFTVLIVLLLAMLGAIHRGDPVVQRLLANPPQRGRAALGVAAIMERLHMLDEARAVVERLQPGDAADGAEAADRLLMLGVLAARSGRHEEARRCLESALESDREFVHRHRLLFALARECDALGRYDEAYAFAEEAHRSHLAFFDMMTGRSAAEDSKLWSLTAEGCTPEDVATWTTSGPAAQDSPVFIVGFPRSGTTLLEQVLDAHPLLRSMDERPFLGTAVSEATARGIRYPAELGRLRVEDLEAIRTAYWERARKRVNLGPGQRLVDKNPLNMNMLPLIRRLFPEAPIILIIRHPCDTLLSCFLQDFRSPGLALLCRDLPTLARAYARTFGFWYSQSALLRPKTHEVVYERLAAAFATEVARVCAFLQLPWDPAMLTPGEHARAKGFIRTPSYAQVIEPVSTRAVGRWKHYEARFGEALPILKPWIERWGYSL
ncbi:MAG: tetratricopeptide repeat protein [Steroidobacteraceae bacterium]